MTGNNICIAVLVLMLHDQGLDAAQLLTCFLHWCRSWCWPLWVNTLESVHANYIPFLPRVTSSMQEDAWTLTLRWNVRKYFNTLGLDLLSLYIWRHSRYRFRFHISFVLDRNMIIFSNANPSPSFWIIRFLCVSLSFLLRPCLLLLSEFLPL